MRSGTHVAQACKISKTFQSTHSMRSGTHDDQLVTIDDMISIHPLHAEWDQHGGILSRCHRNFNPPTPCGVGPGPSSTSSVPSTISIHPLHAEWDNVSWQATMEDYISIHPLHAEWDFLPGEIFDLIPISIHPLHAEWDILRILPDTDRLLFQSTHSMRSGTPMSDSGNLNGIISIHPLHAEWDTASGRHPVAKNISIHPLHAEWDGSSSSFRTRSTNFNPPTPCGVGHPACTASQNRLYFNPPTPCGVGPRSLRPRCWVQYFNPPTPCGVGQGRERLWQRDDTFQSTHSMRSGTRPG